MLNSKYTILNVKPKVAFATFIELLRDIGQINTQLITNIAEATIRHLRGDATARKQTVLGQQIEQRWYASLKTGNPDYSVYATDYYLAELWACWMVYSRRYLLGIQKPNSLPPNGIVAHLQSSRRILDLGCGFGFTTAALQEIFPAAEVIGTNLDNTLQTDVARLIGKQAGFTVVPAIDVVSGPIDLIFASEYFEHIQKPMQHLREILNKVRPSAFLIANAFGQHAVGHFEKYDVNGTLVDGKIASRQFNLELRRHGYSKVKTALWNNRPAFWVKTNR